MKDAQLNRGLSLRTFFIKIHREAVQEAFDIVLERIQKQRVQQAVLQRAVDKAFNCRGMHQTARWKTRRRGS